MKYRVHRFNIRMTRDQGNLERFLNSLESEVVSIIQNVTPFPATYVDFLLIVEQVSHSGTGGPLPQTKAAEGLTLVMCCRVVSASLPVASLDPSWGLLSVCARRHSNHGTSAAPLPGTVVTTAATQLQGPQ